VCCAHRLPRLALAQTADQVLTALYKHSLKHGFQVYAYCVMPDHFHAFVSGLYANSNLLAFIKNFKQTTARQYRKQFGTELWQKKFHERVLRSGVNADAVSGYIWLNPVRSGLCGTPQEYPFSGSFVVDWKKAFLPNEIWVPDWKRTR